MFYFGGAVALAYYIGRTNTGLGIASFFVAVFLWQMFVDGPGSFFEGAGCGYGHAARDC